MPLATDDVERSATYTAYVSDKHGRKLYESPAYTTREEAIVDAFRGRPTANRCSTARARSFDIRWHSRGDGYVQKLLAA